MKLAEKLALKAAQSEAAKFGMTAKYIVKGNHKHSQISVCFKDKCGIISLSCTPRSKSDQVNHMAQDVRRIAKQLGVT